MNKKREYNLVIFSLICLLIISITIPLTAQSSLKAGKPENKLVSSAERALNDSLFSLALEYLRQARANEIYLLKASVEFKLATAFFNLGFYDSAAEHFARAEALEPLDNNALNDFLTSLVIQSDLPSLEQLYQSGRFPGANLDPSILAATLYSLIIGGKSKVATSILETNNTLTKDDSLIIYFLLTKYKEKPTNVAIARELSGDNLRQTFESICLISNYTLGACEMNIDPTEQHTGYYSTITPWSLLWLGERTRLQEWLTNKHHPEALLIKNLLNTRTSSENNFRSLRLNSTSAENRWTSNDDEITARITTAEAKVKIVQAQIGLLEESLKQENNDNTVVRKLLSQLDKNKQGYRNMLLELQLLNSIHTEITAKSSEVSNYWQQVYERNLRNHIITNKIDSAFNQLARDETLSTERRESLAQITAYQPQELHPFSFYDDHSYRLFNNTRAEFMLKSDQYGQAMSSYKRELKAFLDGDRSTEPTRPKPNVSYEINQMKLLIERENNNSVFIYNLLTFYLLGGDTANFIESHQLYSPLLDSKIRGYTNFLRAELAFARNNYSDAEKLYNSAAQTLPSDLASYYIYKKAWCFYLQDEPRKAVDLIAALIDNYWSADKPTTTLKQEVIRTTGLILQSSIAPAKLLTKAREITDDEKLQPNILLSTAHAFRLAKEKNNTINTLQTLNEYYPAFAEKNDVKKLIKQILAGDDNIISFPEKDTSGTIAFGSLEITGNIMQPLYKHHIPIISAPILPTIAREFDPGIAFKKLHYCFIKNLLN